MPVKVIRIRIKILKIHFCVVRFLLHSLIFLDVNVNKDVIFHLSLFHKVSGPLKAIYLETNDEFYFIIEEKKGGDMK